MKTLRYPILFACFFCLFGCGLSQWGHLNYYGAVELNRVKDNGEALTIYQLKRGKGDTGCSLVIRTEETKEIPDLGVSIQEIDKNFAQNKMLTPYKGLYVQNVNPNSMAGKAGMLPGDILLTMNGTELLYRSQYDHLLKNTMDASNEVEITLLRGFGDKKEVSLKVGLDKKKATYPSTKALPLKSFTRSGPVYAGIYAATLPAKWTEKIYDDPVSTVLISGVEVGSPAYRAGLRAGDRVLSVNGKSFETADQLWDWIQEYGPQGAEAIFEVYRKKGGAFTAPLDLERYRSDYDAYLPFIFELDTGPKKTEWDLGPLGLLMGYKGEYLRSYNTRKVNYSRSFSFALGLFKRRWGPKYSRTRLLWFITFSSDDD